MGGRDLIISLAPLRCVAAGALGALARARRAGRRVAAVPLRGRGAVNQTAVLQAGCFRVAPWCFVCVSSCIAFSFILVSSFFRVFSFSLIFFLAHMQIPTASQLVTQPN